MASSNNLPSQEPTPSPLGCTNLSRRRHNKINPITDSQMQLLVACEEGDIVLDSEKHSQSTPPQKRRRSRSASSLSNMLGWSCIPDSSGNPFSCIPIHPASQSSQQSTPKDFFPPTFTKAPQIRQSGGSVVILSCTLTAKPAPLITWFKESQLLQVDEHRYKAACVAAEKEANTYTISLTINDVSEKDAGAYRAVARNDHGENTAVFTIKSDKKSAGADQRPNFVAQPKIRQSAEGVTFECVFTSEEAPEVTWNHNGAQCLAGADGKYKPDLQVAVDGQKNRFMATLMIKKVTVTDGGEYKCVAKNKFGDALANINLNIDKSDGQAPAFVEKPVIRYVGRDIVVAAIVKASPNPEVSWQRSLPAPALPLSNTSKYLTSMTVIQDGIFKLLLTVKDFTVSDNGIYAMTIRNPLGEALGNAEVTFVQREQKISPKLMPATTRGRRTVDGKGLVIGFDFDSFPLPVIRWAFNGQEINPATTKRYEPLIIRNPGSSGLRAELIVQDFQGSADSGTYNATFSNEIGETTFDIKVAPDGNVTPIETPLSNKSAKDTAAAPAKEPEAEMTTPNSTNSNDSQKAEKRKPEVISKEVAFDGEILRIMLMVDSGGTHQEPIARWFFKGMSVQGKRYVQKIKQKENLYSVKLEVEDANTKDAGNYKCKVGNGYGDAIVLLNVTPNELKVERKDIPPRFNRKLQPQDIPESEPASFICTVTGTEPITWKWLLHGKELSSSDSNFEMAREKNRITLKIKEVWASDSGEVECIAENPFGKASTAGRLTVQENIQLKGLKKRPTQTKASDGQDDDDVMDPFMALLLMRAGGGSLKDAAMSLRSVKRNANRRPSHAELSSGGPNASKRPDSMEIPPNSPYLESVPDNQVINKGCDFYTEVQVNVPDPATMPFPTIKWFSGVPRRRGDSGVMKELKQVSDKRVTVKADEPNICGSLSITKCEAKDEGYFGVCLLNSDGDVLDRAGFSIFIKDPDQNFDFRNLLKRTHIDEEDESEEEVEWGTLKRTFVPTVKAKKGRRRHGAGSAECLEEYEEEDDIVEPLSSMFYRPRAATFSPFGEAGDIEDCGTLTPPMSYAKRQQMRAQELEERLEASRAQKMNRRLSLMEAIPNFPVLRKAPTVVVEKGYFEEEIEDRNAVFNETKEVVFSCVFSEDNHKARWFKGRSEIFLGHKYMLDTDGRKHTLIVKKPTSDDTGPYTCDIDGVTTTAMLMVEVKRTRIERQLPPRSKIVRKSTTVLEVELSDDKTEPQWFKDGKPLAPKRGKIEIAKHGQKATLSILNGSPEDAGNYSCTVEDSSSGTTLGFEEANWKFVEKLKNASTTEDSPAVFTCTVNEPNADVVWLVNGEEIQPDNRRFEIGSNGMNRTLTLKKPKRGDNDLKITCKSSADKTDAVLTVKGLFQLDDQSACYCTATSTTTLISSSETTTTTTSSVHSQLHDHRSTSQMHATSSALYDNSGGGGSGALGDSYRGWLSSMGMSSALSIFTRSSHENSSHVTNISSEATVTAEMARPVSPQSVLSSGDGYVTPMDVDDMSTSGSYATPMNAPGTPEDEMSIEGDDEIMTVVGEGDGLCRLPSLPSLAPSSPIPSDSVVTHNQLGLPVPSIFSQPSSPIPVAAEDEEKTSSKAEPSGSFLRPLFLPKQKIKMFSKATSLDSADEIPELLINTEKSEPYGLLRPAQRSFSNAGLERTRSPALSMSPTPSVVTVPAGLTADPVTLVEGLSKIKNLHDESVELAARLSHHYGQPKNKQPMSPRQPLSPELSRQHHQQQQQHLLLQQQKEKLISQQHQQEQLMLQQQQVHQQQQLLQQQQQPQQVQPKQQLKSAQEKRLLMSRPARSLDEPPLLSSKKPVGPKEFAERMVKLRQEAAELAERLRTRHSSGMASSVSPGRMSQGAPLSPRSLASLPHIDDDLMGDDDIFEKASSTGRSVGTPKQVSFDLPDEEEVAELGRRHGKHGGSMSIKAVIEEKYQKLLSKFGIKNKRKKLSKFGDNGRSQSEDNLTLANIPEEECLEGGPKFERKSSWRKKFRKAISFDNKKNLPEQPQKDKSPLEAQEQLEEEVVVSPSKLVIISPSEARSSNLSSSSASSIQQMAQRLLQPIEEVAEQSSIEQLNRSRASLEAYVEDDDEEFHMAPIEQLEEVMMFETGGEEGEPVVMRTIDGIVHSAVFELNVQEQYQPTVTFHISSISTPEDDSYSLSESKFTDLTSFHQMEPSRVANWLDTHEENKMFEKPPSEATSESEEMSMQPEIEDVRGHPPSLVAEEADLEWKFRRISQKFHQSSTDSNEESSKHVESKYQKILERYSLKRQVSDVTPEVGSAEKIPTAKAKMSWDRKTQFSLDEPHSNLYVEGPKHGTSSAARPLMPRHFLPLQQPNKAEVVEQSEITDSVFSPLDESADFPAHSVEDKKLAEQSEIAQNYLNERTFQQQQETVSTATEEGLKLESETVTTSLQHQHVSSSAGTADQVAFREASDSVEVKTFETEVDFANPIFRELPELQLAGEMQHNLMIVKPAIEKQYVVSGFHSPSNVILHDQPGLSKALSVEELRCFEREGSLTRDDAILERSVSHPAINVMVRCQSSEHVSLNVPPYRQTVATMATYTPIKEMSLGLSEETVSVDDISKAESFVEDFADYHQIALPVVSSTQIQVTSSRALTTEEAFLTAETEDDGSFGDEVYFLPSHNYETAEATLEYLPVYESTIPLENIISSPMFKRRMLDSISEVSEHLESVSSLATESDHLLTASVVTEQLTSAKLEVFQAGINVAEATKPTKPQAVSEAIRTEQKTQEVEETTKAKSPKLSIEPPLPTKTKSDETVKTLGLIKSIKVDNYQETLSEKISEKLPKVFEHKTSDNVVLAASTSRDKQIKDADVSTTSKSGNEPLSKLPKLKPTKTAQMRESETTSFETTKTEHISKVAKTSHIETSNVSKDRAQSSAVSVQPSIPPTTESKTGSMQESDKTRFETKKSENVSKLTRTNRVDSTTVSHIKATTVAKDRARSSAVSVQPSTAAISTTSAVVSDSGEIRLETTKPVKTSQTEAPVVLKDSVRNSSVSVQPSTPATSTKTAMSDSGKTDVDTTKSVKTSQIEAPTVPKEKARSSAVCVQQFTPTVHTAQKASSNEATTSSAKSTTESTSRESTQPTPFTSTIKVVERSSAKQSSSLQYACESPLAIAETTGSSSTAVPSVLVQSDVSQSEQNKSMTYCIAPQNVTIEETVDILPSTVSEESKTTANAATVQKQAVELLEPATVVLQPSIQYFEKSIHLNWESSSSTIQKELAEPKTTSNKLVVQQAVDIQDTEAKTAVTLERSFKAAESNVKPPSLAALDRSQTVIERKLPPEKKAEELQKNLVTEEASVKQATGKLDAAEQVDQGKALDQASSHVEQQPTQVLADSTSEAKKSDKLSKIESPVVEQQKNKAPAHVQAKEAVKVDPGSQQKGDAVGVVEQKTNPAESKIPQAVHPEDTNKTASVRAASKTKQEEAGKTSVPQAEKEIPSKNLSLEKQRSFDAEKTAPEATKLDEPKTHQVVPKKSAESDKKVPVTSTASKTPKEKKVGKGVDSQAQLCPVATTKQKAEETKKLIKQASQEKAQSVGKTAEKSAKGPQKQQSIGDSTANKATAKSQSTEAKPDKEMVGPPKVKDGQVRGGKEQAKVVDSVEKVVEPEKTATSEVEKKQEQPKKTAKKDNEENKTADRPLEEITSINADASDVRQQQPPLSVAEPSKPSQPAEAVKPMPPQPKPPVAPSKPVPPLAPKGARVTDVDSARATLSWEAPESGDNCPVKSYIIEARDKTSGKWVKVKEVPTGDTSALVEKLENGKEYEFRVMAKNDLGLSEASEATTMTLIKGKKVPARISDKNLLMGSRIKRGQAFNLTANYTGEPEPSVSWTIDGKEVPKDDNLTITSGNFKSVFDLKDAKRKQSAIYRIEVNNSSGKDYHEIELVVLASPTQPGGPLKVSDVKKNSCKLQWAAPEDMGGSEFLGYKVEKFDPEKGTWETVKEGVQKPELDVGRLQEGHKYKFRVSAQNTQGASEPLETQDFTVAKNPFDPPGKPGKPKVVDSSPTFIEVEWLPPASDGGAKITGYHIERADPKTNRYTRITKEPVIETNYHDSRVSAGRAYKYRAVAVNAGGDSEPSDPSDELIAKNLKEVPKIDMSFLPLGGEIRVKAGDPISVAIPVTGEPAPTIKWEKDGMSLPQSLNQEKKEGEVKLTTPAAVRSQHSGNYTLSATNPSGTVTTQLKIVVLDKPGPPEGPIEVTNVTAETCQLAWTPPKQDGGSEITGYLVEKREVGSSIWQKCATMVTAPNTTVRNLEEGKKYEFRVTAENLVGTSEPLQGSSPVLIKNPFDPPGSPEKLQIVAVDAVSASLAWEPPLKDGGRPVKGYVVEKKSAGSSKWTRAVQYTVSNTEFLVTGLLEGDDMQFRVAAVNEAGPGEFSRASQSVTIKDPVILAGAPGSPTVDKITKDTVRLSWTKPSKEGNSKIVGYVVEAAGDGDDWQEVASVSAKETSAAVKNLKEGEKKKFRIRAVNAGGPGDPSRPTAVLTIADQPEKPSFGVGQLQPITVKCGQPFTLTVPFTAHPIPTAVWKLNDTELKADPKNMLSMKVENGQAVLTCPRAMRSDNGEYTLTLTNSEGSGTIKGNVKVLSRPAEPKGPIEVDSNDGETMTLSWKPPTDDGGQPITHYQVEKRVEGSNKWTRVAGTSDKPTAHVRNLEPGERYEFRVIASNDLGDSEPLETMTSVLAKSPFDPPGKPSAPRCETTTPDSVTIKWDEPTSDGGAPIRGYIVEKRPKGEKKWLKVCEAPDNQATVRGLSEDREYEFRVTAVNTAGKASEPSETSTAIKAQPPPTAPRIRRDGAGLPHEVRVKAGESFKIPIPYSGFPPPTCKWSQEGKPVTMDDRHNCDVTRNAVTLNTSAAQRGDSGQYTAVIENDLGKDQINVNVVVIDVPGSPENLEVTEVTDTTATLTWSPPKDDGGCPIQNYVVEKCDVRLAGGTDRQLWEKVTRFARNTNVVVDDLNEGHDYLFRVCAENEVGVSKPVVLARAVKTVKTIRTPGSPSSVSVSDIDKDSATIRWDKPYNDGGDSNCTYVVEMLDKRTGEWKPLNTAGPVKGNEFKATKLPENGDVEFRVCARNEAGLGKPSESTGLVRLKSKYSKASAPSSLEVSKRETFPKLEWMRPKSDGGSRIVGYVVECKSPTESTWTPLTQNPVPDQNLVLTPEVARMLTLSGSPTTQFRVAAVTQHGGVGEFSMPTSSFYVKDLVMTAPSVDEGLKDQTGKYGADLKFKCKVNGSGPMNVKWFVGDAEVTPGGRFRTYRNDADGEFTLAISGLEEGDAGMVRLQVTNSLGQDSTSAMLKVTRPPKFDQNLMEHTVSDGESAKLKIPFTGSEPVTFTLKRNGRPVDPSKYRISYLNKFVTVTLKDCNAADTGSYNLEAEIGDDTDSMSIRLAVESPPAAPTGPLKVSDISKNSCTVSWRPPTSDGGSKITHYVVERRDVSKEYWTTVSSVVKDLNIFAQGLTENSQYKFRVAAVNAIGQSEWLEISSPITAKLPFDPPAPPQAITVTAVGADFVNLSWDRPLSDGGGRLLGYAVERREADSNGTWLRMTPSDKLCIAQMFNVPHLIEDRKYEFRVFAVNEAGESQPLETARPVLVRDSNAASVPVFRVPLKKITASEGSRAEFTCTIECSQNPDVTWFKGTRELGSSTAKYEMSSDGSGTYRLSIRDCQLDDEDEILVRAKTAAGSRQSRADLIVQAAPRIRLPNNFSTTITLSAGDELDLRIPFTSNPRPTAKWTADSREIQPSDRVIVALAARHALLTVRRLTRADSGSYKLTIQNALGEDSVILSLNVVDRPTPPAALNVETLDNEAVVLKWSPPSNDGGSPITGYIVEKREEGMDSWIRCALSKSATVSISSLLDNKSYQFRVIAENAYARSDPCEASRGVMVEVKSRKRFLGADMNVDFWQRQRSKNQETVSDYDKYYQDLHAARKVRSATINTAKSIYDSYEILEELGRGTFGVVHRCREKATGDIYAVKFLHCPTNEDKAVVRNEVNVMNQLIHPRLLHCHEVFEAHDEMAVVLEFLSGGEIMEKLSLSSQISEEDIIAYIRQVCEGVKKMHDLGIVHLDIKPANVLFENKHSNSVKLVDFGLATKLNVDEVVKVSLATVDFAAPEVIQYDPVGFYTDMWSIGVLSYILLSGLSPFVGSSESETSQNIARGRWSFNETAFSSVSKEARDFIEQLLIVDGSRRMTIYEALDHPWLAGVVKGSSSLSSANHRELFKRLHERRAEYERSILALGRLTSAGYGSLRRNRLKEFNVYESRFDRRELAPRIIRKPLPAVVIEGQAAIITCVVYALSPPIITWYAGGVKALVQSVKHMQLSSGDTYTLKVSRCEMDDAGEYLVRAENSFGTKESSTSVSVIPSKSGAPVADAESSRVRHGSLGRNRMLDMLSHTAIHSDDEVDSKPIITFHLRDRLIQQGDYCKLLCCISGRPKPQIFWQKDGHPMDVGHGTQGFSNGVASYEFVSCKTEDSGRYTCRAVNQHGETETTCLVRVEAQPLGLRRPSMSTVQRVDFRERSCEPAMLAPRTDRRAVTPSMSYSTYQRSTRHTSPSPVVIAGAYIHHPSLSHAGSWSSLNTTANRMSSSFASSTMKSSSSSSSATSSHRHFKSGSHYDI